MAASNGGCGLWRSAPTRPVPRSIYSAPPGGTAWCPGRIDADKAPHLAVMAAARLGRRLRIVGPTRDPHYLHRHRATLTAPNVDFVGELAGAAKLQVLASARTLVYSCARGYIEAGAAVFGEALRCGTPIAAAFLLAEAIITAEQLDPARWGRSVWPDSTLSSTFMLWLALRADRHRPPPDSTRARCTRALR
ncbi:MAG: glycosyltransferase [Pseudonocardiaceae bacterium]